MKRFSVTYSTKRGLLLLAAIIVNVVWGVPLPRTIADSTKEEVITKSSTRGQFDNLYLSTALVTTFQGLVNAVLKNFQNQPLPANGMAPTKEEGVTVKRSRRSVSADESDNCSVTNQSLVLWPGNVYTQLNASTFLGLNPEQENLKELDGEDVCPYNREWDWPKSDRVNLKSLCPWRWDVTDLSQEYNSQIYPRYVREAVCLCRDGCLTMTTPVKRAFFGCEVLHLPMDVYEKTDCLDGLAVLVRKRIHIKQGCHCIRRS